MRSKGPRKPAMIFHVPFTMDPDSRSASGIRPFKMRQAFVDAGYEVLEVSGDHEQRKRQIRALKRKIKRGLRPVFAYSEAKTTPTGLGEPITRHTSLTRDIRFLRFCKSHGIPTGLFYRDVYWQFPEFTSYASRPWRTFLKSRYRADLRGYKKALSIFYVPSMGCADHLPDLGNSLQIRELPPGLDIVDAEDGPTYTEGDQGQPRILYVGGIGPSYRIQDAVQAVNQSGLGSMIVCVREEEWREEKSNYEGVRTADEPEAGSIMLTHAAGEDLEPLYAWAQVGSLFMAPDEYRKIAVPYKLYEYLGHGKPVVASEGTHVGDLVRQYRLGWVVPPSTEGFRDWLTEMQTNPETLRELTKNVHNYRQQHTWVERARQVATDLIGKKSSERPVASDEETRVKPRLLILCFSDIWRDTRVLKQIRLFEKDYAVTTCGFGKAPDANVTHIEVSRHISKPIELLRAAFIRLRMYRFAYWTTPAVRQAKASMNGQVFDAVLANDLDTAGVAEAISPPARVHMDIHEYWPGLYDQNPAWVRLRKPYYEWMLRHFVSKAKSVTVVNDVTSQKYETEFGIKSNVVPNASQYRDLRPTEVGRPLRAVYAGGPNPLRRIDDLMKAGALADGVTLDLYLLGEGTDHYKSLQRLAAELGDSVRILPPLRSEELVAKLNEYDIGFHSLPPTNTNHLTTMPNKYYEYIQARLALVLGPSPTMRREAENFAGAVFADDFSVEALARALSSLSRDDVQKMKHASHMAAKDVASERYDHIWAEAIGNITSA